MTIKDEILKGTVEIMGGGVLTIGLVNVSGFVFGLPGLYTWAHDVAMAFPTAIGFLLTGFCLIILASRYKMKVEP